VIILRHLEVYLLTYVRTYVRSFVRSLARWLVRMCMMVRDEGLKRKRAALKDTGEDLGSVEKVKEANLSREVSMTVLDILASFMDDFKEVYRNWHANQP
jgi:hypothetical protein